VRGAFMAMPLIHLACRRIVAKVRAMDTDKSCLAGPAGDYWFYREKTTWRNGCRTTTGR
jgi:hypothetical protein